MLDHYYDKLLRIAPFDPEFTQNEWLVQESKKRLQDMVNVCILFGTDQVKFFQLLQECASELMLAKSPIPD